MPFVPKDRDRLTSKPDNDIPATSTTENPVLQGTPASAPSSVSPSHAATGEGALSDAAASALNHIDSKRSRTDRTGPNWTPDGDYLVGRNKPPKQTQWKPGQSGNPAGPKKREPISAEDAFFDELLKPFNMKINGVEVRTTPDAFVISTLKTAAAKGTVRAQLELLKLVREGMTRKARNENRDTLEDWEQALIDTMLADYGLSKNPVVRREREWGPSDGSGGAS